MIDRIKIEETKSSIRYSFANDEGIIVTQGCIPKEEWNSMKNKLIVSYKYDETDWDLLDYMTVLSDIAETS